MSEEKSEAPEKYGKMGAPGSEKRKAFMASIRKIKRVSKGDVDPAPKVEISDHVEIVDPAPKVEISDHVEIVDPAPKVELVDLEETEEEETEEEETTPDSADPEPEKEEEAPYVDDYPY